MMLPGFSSRRSFFDKSPDNSLTQKAEHYVEVRQVGSHEILFQKMNIFLLAGTK